MSLNTAGSARRTSCKTPRLRNKTQPMSLLSDFLNSWGVLLVTDIREKLDGSCAPYVTMPMAKSNSLDFLVIRDLEAPFSRVRDAINRWREPLLISCIYTQIGKHVWFETTLNVKTQILQSKQDSLDFTTIAKVLHVHAT
jgi:hypothetical protein